MNIRYLKQPKALRTIRSFRPVTLLLLGVVYLGIYSGAAAQDVDVSPYQRDANRIIEAATTTHRAYERLGELVDTFGHRLSGSVALELSLIHI